MIATLPIRSGGAHKDGYSAMVAAMLAHPMIELQLGTPMAARVLSTGHENNCCWMVNLLLGL